MIARVRGSLAGLSGPQKMLAGGLAAAAVGGVAAAYEIGKFADHSVKAAASFQQMSTLLVTQAGVAKSRIAGLGDQFLTLAPKFGTTAGAMNEAFYHISSASVPVREQMGALKAAAMGAAIGNASLEDTTNSLVGVLRSGISGFHGARDAMATVMAIVGTGNMRLQELNAAMGTGLAGAAKTFGVSLQSVGAPLAYLTDTGMKAQMAATRLTMAIALLGGPSQHASKILGALGMTSDQIKSKFAVVSQALEKAGISTSRMAADMHKPDGIVVALQDLKTHMEQAGLSANTQAAIISRAFGGGHMGKAIMQLFEELPRAAQKFNIINRSVSQFGTHWQETTKTAVFQAKSLHGAMGSISIAIGEALLPAVQKLLAHIVPVVAAIARWVTHHKTLAAIILGSAFAIAVLTAAIGAVGLAMMAFAPISLPVIGIVLGIMAAVALLAFGIYELVKHWDAIWGAITRIAREAWDEIRGFLFTTWNRIVADAENIWHDFKGWLGTLWGAIRADAVAAWNDFSSFFGGIWQTIKNDALVAWNAIKGIVVPIWNDIVAVAKAIWDVLKHYFMTIWDVLTGNWSGAWSNLKATLVAVWDAIKAYAQLVWDALKTYLRLVWDGISAVWGAVWDGIKSVLTADWDLIKTAARLVWEALKNTAVAVWDGVKAVWGAVWGEIKTVLTADWDLIKSIAHAVWAALNDAASGAWDGVKAVWGAVWGEIKTVLSNDWGLIKSGATTVWGWLGSTAKTVWDGVEGIWGKVWRGIKTAITSPINTIIGLIEAVIRKVEEAWKVIKKAGSFLGIGAKNVTVPAGTGSLGRSQRNLPHFAKGGIVNGPTIAMIGENGPEAVVPLSAMGRFGGGGGQTVVLDFSGSQFWGPQDVDAFISRFGARLATYLLPGAGMRVRRS